MGSLGDKINSIAPTAHPIYLVL